ncbi:MAG TPA: hypothetical protein VJ810_11460 [Blastocatellia bacterium]|nr:hypothetical protein [Blastocatellia bacterium]
MNKGKRVTVIITAVFMMSGIAAAQRRPRPKPKPAPPAPATTISTAPAKRPVTVNLKEGEPVTGNFLRADAETVQIEIRSGQLTIKMGDVASLIFTEEGETAARPAEEEQKETSAPAPDPSLPAARKAYAALRKLAEAAKIKLPLGQYGNLLIETKPVVEEALMEISEYTLKNEIARAMDAYSDAGQAWGAARAYDTGRTNWGAARVIEQRIPVDGEPGATLMRKYQIKPGVNRLGQADHLELDTALKAIWAVATARLNYIAALIRQ